MKVNRLPSLLQKGPPVRDYLDLACTTPYDEPCIQVGHPNSIKWGKLEARTFRDQLIREIGEPPEGAQFKIVVNPHDFGSYVSLAIFYETDKEEATRYAFDAESADVIHWDTSSQEKLREEGYPFKEVV